MPTAFVETVVNTPAHVAARTPTNDRQPAVDRLIYCCLASPGVKALGWQDLIAEQTLLEPARKITGLLMWDGRLMIHCLEGPCGWLESTWAQIQSDPRQHCLVMLRYEQDISKRALRRWQMQPVSRGEMVALVRNLREDNARSAQNLQKNLHTDDWAHAIGTLSIMLNPDSAALYAPSRASKLNETHVERESRSRYDEMNDATAQRLLQALRA